jgi:hypothetical protein
MGWKDLLGIRAAHVEGSFCLQLHYVCYSLKDLFNWRLNMLQRGFCDRKENSNYQ